VPEPTVQIPARLAVVVMKHLWHLAPVVPSHTADLRALVDVLSRAVAAQLAPAELDQALIAARIEISNQGRPAPAAGEGGA
jgi:hypothetical protein